MAEVQDRHYEAAKVYSRSVDWVHRPEVAATIAQVLADQEAELTGWLNDEKARVAEYAESRSPLEFAYWLLDRVRSGEWRGGDAG